MSVSSRFFWHDLMAADVEGAKKFYGELFGWRFKRGAQDDYEHIHAGEVGIGGIMKNPQTGAPPHWLGYVAVDDVDKTVAAIQKIGGKVHMPKMDIPEVGQFAITADPHGAVFSPMHYIGKDANKPEPDRPGAWTFCWDELLTPDPDASAKFYSTVFGWGVEKLDMPGMQYTLLKRKGVKDSMGSERNAAGVMKMMPGVPHPFWMAYVAVDNADESVTKAKRLGANVVVPPTDIPNVGRFACLMDPQQAAISVLQPNR